MIAIILTFASSQVQLLIENVSGGSRVIPITVFESLESFSRKNFGTIGNIFGDGHEEEKANQFLETTVMIAKLAFFVLSLTISNMGETYERFSAFKERE